jgi:LysR family transcriptional regulator, glycine cleavage system transcriptional activator
VVHLPSLFGLRAFEAAVRLGSYSGAARELAVTQGAVSQQIRRLELRLGTRLFVRRGNWMAPTAAAVRLAEGVRDATHRLQAAVDECAAGALADALVLSVENRFGSRWLGPKLPRLLADPAGARLEIRVEERVSDFANDGVDVAVRLGRGDWPGLDSRRLTIERLCVVCSPEFVARFPICCARDLLNVPLIHSPEKLWSLLFDRYGLAAPRPAGLVSNDSLVVLEAVGRGLGAALVRRSLVEEDIADGRLLSPIPDSVALPLNFIRPGKLVRSIRPDEPTPPELGYFLAWPADTRKRARIEALRDWLVAAAGTFQQA